MYLWKELPLYPKPGSPVHSWRKFSAVLGAQKCTQLLLFEKSKCSIFRTWEQRHSGAPLWSCQASAHRQPCQNILEAAARPGNGVKITLVGNFFERFKCKRKFQHPPQLTGASHQPQLHKPKSRARWSQELPALERLACQGWRPLQVCKAASFQDGQNPHHHQVAIHDNRFIHS